MPIAAVSYGKKSNLVDWVGQAQDLADSCCASDQNPSIEAIVKLISLDSGQPFVISFTYGPTVLLPSSKEPILFPSFPEIIAGLLVCVGF